ncbi:hypothetical protein CEUSTIGMA_g68.t1 [Chlamydomonas eustigma]|uniref:Myb-like domain-containing protein n=1 Tax=Chlamydomonas eustigma TaxID=1157962 RepID=A0A250WPM8_9CHLO|nr:hypothetical protein CEUSTIGMA_g68.t1 [Chlamydomonas eustigma]|eukprot:GAX72612.1 hypothetical protein CEUSTIGMA_g68.t1 [Chlamydomonas eustigma]
MGIAIRNEVLLAHDLRQDPLQQACTASNSDNRRAEGWKGLGKAKRSASPESLPILVQGRDSVASKRRRKDDEDASVDDDDDEVDTRQDPQHWQQSMDVTSGPAIITSGGPADLSSTPHPERHATDPIATAAGFTSGAGPLPLFPLSIGHQMNAAMAMTPATALGPEDASASMAAGDLNAAAAAAAAAAANNESLQLQMWLQVQQQAAAMMAAAGEAHDHRAMKTSLSSAESDGMSAAVEAAKAAAVATGADEDTAAAMSAQFAAIMSDPNAVAAAISDPNNPASIHLMAQLAQMSHFQMPPGSTVADSFSALVAAAVGAYEMEGASHPGGALPPGMMGLPDPAMLQLTGAAAGLTGQAGAQAMADLQGGHNANKVRGRPKKQSAGAVEVGGATMQAAPSGNWMRRFHELAYLADKATLDSAKMTNMTMTLQVQWANMPEELQNKLSMAPAPVEVPTNATVSFLRRAIDRTLGGHLHASILRNGNRDLLQDSPDDRELHLYGITHNSYILLETEFHEIPNFGAAPPSNMRLNSLGSPGSFSTPGSGSRVGTKERFTLTEMYSLVEGMEQHGLKWAKIHKDFKDLDNKTQGDLKDKWRNWQRNVQNGWTTARVYMPDELKQRIEKLVHDYNQQTGGSGGIPGQRMMQAASPNDQVSHDAMAAAAALYGLDASQLAQFDPATTAAMLQQAQHHAAAAAAAAHHQHQEMQGHYEASMASVNAMAAGASELGMSGHAVVETQMEGVSVGPGDSLTAVAEHMLTDPNAAQGYQGQY